MPTEAAGINHRRYNTVFASKISTGRATNTMANCPISTPKLKARIDSSFWSPGKPSSPKTPAKPMPWSKPNEKVTQPKRNISGLTLFNAAKSTETAMPNSTQRLLGTIQPKAVAVNVTECAKVKALMIHTVVLSTFFNCGFRCHCPSSRNNTQGKSNANKNKIWSVPIQIWMIPW